MEQEQKGEASSGVYTYKHHYDKGLDIHEIFVKKCRTRVLLSYVGVVFLLANICQSLLAKEKLCLGSLWSITFGILVAKCLQYKPVKKGESFLKYVFVWPFCILWTWLICTIRLHKKSIVIMPTFGVQLEKHFWSGRIHRRFVPIGKILKPLLNECVTPVTCYWSLVLLLRDEEELILVFQKFRPPVKMLVPIWKALCAITSSGCPRPSAVSEPNCSET